jgi:hypothetical protein
MLGIDRSAAAVNAAKKRNREHVREGRAQFRVAELERMKLEPGAYDEIFAFNVGALRRQPAQLEKLRGALAKAGRLYLFEQPPSAAMTAGVAKDFLSALQAARFEVRDVVFGEFEPAAVVCVIATRV